VDTRRTDRPDLAAEAASAAATVVFPTPPLPETTRSVREERPGRRDVVLREAPPYGRKRDIIGTLAGGAGPSGAPRKATDMGESLFDQIRARGEGFLTEVSNNLLANPAFVEVLKKGVAAKEEIDRKVAEGLRAMNVVTRKDIHGLESRIADLERELEALKAKPATKTARKK
jgi:polyhydroxyalkanoate synthesis regulator phasin